jgi:hypothetical protein
VRTEDLRASSTRFRGSGFERLFDNQFRGTFATLPVNSRRSNRNQAGKAEFGLLLALFLFGGGVAGALWFVVKSDHRSAPVAAAPPKEAQQPRSMSPVVRPAMPGEPARRTSVTIVADPQAQSALAKLRKITPDEGTAPKSAKPPEIKVEAPPVAQFDVDAQQIDSQSAEARRAADLLKQYLAAKSWQEKLPLVYQSAQARPLMEEFYGSQGLADPVLEGKISATDIKVGTRNVLTLSFVSGDRLDRVVHASFWRTTAGLLLDWESFVGFSGKGMGAFRASRYTQPTVFRVLALPDDYYNFEFTDSKKYLCLRLYSPGGEDYLHGYCVRDSTDGKKLVEILGDHSDSQTAIPSRNGLRPQASGHLPITVNLAFPENAQSDRCVKIEKFVSPWWLALDVEKQTTASMAADGPAAPLSQ